MKAIVLFLILALTNLFSYDFVKISLLDFTAQVSKATNKNIYIDYDLNSTISLYISNNISQKNLFKVYKKSISKVGFYLQKNNDVYFLKKILDKKRLLIYPVKYDSLKDCTQYLDFMLIEYKYLQLINSLYINVPFEKYDYILKNLNEIDVKKKQVKLKITIFEYNSENLRDIGLQLGTAYQNINSDTKFALNSIIGSVLSSSSGLILSSNSFYSAFKLLSSNKSIRVKQNPFIVVKNNLPFSFSAVTNVPYLISTVSTQATNTSQQNSIDYKDVGLKMSGKVLIHKDYVNLSLNLVVEDFLNNELSQTPTTFKRLLRSDIDLPFNKMVLISGLKRIKHIKNDYSIPYLSNIPYFGKIFEYKTDSEEQINLTIGIEVLFFDHENIFTLPHPTSEGDEEEN